MPSFSELWNSIRSRNAVVPAHAEIVPSHVIGGLPGPNPILPHRHYFAIVVNELFLEHGREWHRTFDPVVLAITEFVYGGKTITLPFVIGPKLLGSHADTVPQGMIYRNTRVAGIHPFRGGRVISTVVLCRSRRQDYARQLVKLVESVSTAVPFAGDLGTYTKLASSVLDGMDALFGVGETEPLAGLRQEFDHDLGNSIRPAFFALIDAPEADVPADRLWVQEGSLMVGDRPEALQPFRAASYVLFSTRGATELSELDTLPFAETARAIVQLAASTEEADWKRAKAELLVLYQQLLRTPDLTSDQADEYHTSIVEKVKKAREVARSIGNLDVSPAFRDQPISTPADETTEKLRRAVALLDLD